MTLGEKLKKLRTEANLSKTSVAEKAGLSVATYSSYEAGKRLPTRSPENYEKLAKVLGCTVAYLQGEPDEPAAPARVQEPAAAAETPVRVELQYGDKAVEIAALVARAKELDANVTDLYVKPEENRAYYVAGAQTGSFEL